MKFSEMNLKPHLIEGLTKIGYTEATEVQEKSFPLVESGKDVIVRSKTGSGKTFAFLLPLLNKLTPDRHVQGLVIAPTRELAQQIEQEARKVDKKVKTVLLYGGVSINPQMDKLERGAQLVVATPGRLLDHIERGTINLQTTKFAVLDEADRMLDMGFIDDVAKIFAELPVDKQVMLFSATMPEQIRSLAAKHMRETEELMLQQDEVCVKKIRQQVLGMDRRKKLDTLFEILRKNRNAKMIIFCNTKSWAERLGSILYKRRYKVTSIHSGLSQNKRTRVISDFNSGRYSIMVATDVAARGLHIENVTHVVNYDVPRNPKDYVHRIGRTGRAGKDGDAITFVTQIDQHLLRAIEGEVAMTLQVKEVGGAQLDASKARQMKPLAPMVQVHTHGDAAGSDWGLD